MEKPATGTLWTYKGKEYQVTDNAFKVKDPDSGVWHDGVMYAPTVPDAIVIPRYARQLGDFLAKFKPVQ